MAERVRVVLTVDTTKFMAAMARVAKAASRFHRALARHNRHRARCAICSPMANPAPLPIDGHAYQRRRKGRTRR